MRNIYINTMELYKASALFKIKWQKNVRKRKSTSLAESSSLNNVIRTLFSCLFDFGFTCFCFASNETGFVCVAAKWLHVSWKPYGL